MFQTVAPLALGCVVLSACTLPYEQLSLPGPITGSIPANGSQSTAKSGAPLAANASQATLAHRNFPGTGDFTGKGSPQIASEGSTAPSASPGGPATANPASTSPTSTSEVTKDGITLNLVGASVTEVAKTVLGDILGVNYTVSDKVKATITLRTANPVEKAGLLAIFEAILREEGAALIVDGGLYKIVPSTQAVASGAPLRTRKSGQPSVGVATDLVPLRYVGAAEMERILKSASPQASILRVDTARNLLMISGTRAELTSMSELIRVFDVDWMRGMSFGIYPIETSDPEAIAQELDTVFANDKDSPTKGVVRFIPNRRLKSIMVITSRPDYLKKAETWLSRIDLASKATEKQVYVYHVQHRPAAELAQLLQKVYQSSTGGSITTASTSSRGPGSATGPVDGSATGGSAASPVSGGSSVSSAGGIGATTGTSGGSTVGIPPQSPATGTQDGSALPGGSDQQASASSEAARTAFGGGLPKDDRAAGITVIADEIKNSLVITATASEYKRVKQVLYRIDTEGVQILLEATIAEVTLNDNLKFGVRWFLKGGNNTATSGSSVITSVLPTSVTAAAAGFQYFLNATNLQVVLNALSAVTNVTVVSSPSLMVAENKRATLQVGNEVPIITQQQQSTTAVSAIVNSVSYRSTGVILAITPRLSDDGKVFLEIEQEVSDAVNTTTSTTTGSPTIQQRRVKTTVSVNDGETIMLAGLMQDKSTRDREQIPIIGNIPWIGNAFKTKNDTIERTELLISITPQVIRSRLQMDDVTAEYRDKLNMSTRPQRRAPPDTREDLDRILR
jgi:general secretion pathway protein D